MTSQKGFAFVLGLFMAFPCAVHSEPLATEELANWHPLREGRTAEVRTDPVAGMQPFTYERLSRVQALLEDSKFARAISVLEGLSVRGMNDYERAVIAQNFAYVYAQQGDEPRAFEAYEACVALNTLPTPVQQSIVYSLAGYYASEERYEASNEMMMRWFRYEQAPTAEAYLLMGTNHLDLEALPQALQYVRRANALAEPPQESWMQVELAILFETKNYIQAIELLERMLGIWPQRARYYSALAGLLLETGQESRALSALMVPWLHGLLVDGEDILTLVRLNLYLGDPERAAVVLHQAMELEYVDAQQETLELLLGAWIEAREMRHAVDAIDRLAQLADDGEHFLRKAQLLNETGDWEAVVEASRTALEKGGLEQAEDAWMLAGIALTELERYAEALDAFESAKREAEGEAREQAAAWISYVRERSG